MISTSCRMSWQSLSWSSQCFQSSRFYSGMPEGTGAMVITRVVAGVGIDVDGMFVGVGAGIGVAVVGILVGVDPRVVVVGAGVGPSVVSLGAVGEVPGGCPGGCPISSPHSAPPLAKFVNSPSCAAVIALAISAVPPSSAKRHCIPTRSSGLIPNMGAVASHSWSVRHATVTDNAAMLPAMALPGLPSIPALMTSLGSMTSNAARTQSEDSWLSGPGPGTNPARKIRSMVSSSRHPMYLVCLSGFSPIHSFSASDSSENIAPESSAWRGASTPGGAGVAVGLGVGVLAGVALGAAVGLSVGVSVETRAVDAGAADAGAAVGVGAEIRATISGAGVGSEQAVSVARVNRMMRVATSGRCT